VDPRDPTFRIPHRTASVTADNIHEPPLIALSYSHLHEEAWRQSAELELFFLGYGASSFAAQRESFPLFGSPEREGGGRRDRDRDREKERQRQRQREGETEIPKMDR
jgi:hypothetical protein